ncbi:hypothetical protein Tco_0614066 [Tanacetum coccineum]
MVQPAASTITRVLVNVEPSPERKAEETPSRLEGEQVDMGVSKESDPPPLKLLKASKEIRPDPDAEVLIDYEINEKIYQITLEELKAFLRKGAN